jgi:hypothetical protein
LDRAAVGGFDAVTLVLAFLYYFVTYTVIISATRHSSAPL